MRWWIALALGTIAYWLCVAVFLFFFVIIFGHCGAAMTDAENAQCVAFGHAGLWTVITVALVTYGGLVARWIATNRSKRRRANFRSPPKAP
jgi:hypothetical protein